MRERPRRLAIALTALSVFASTCLVAITSDTPSGAALLPAWNPTTLPLLNGQSGAGQNPPILANDVIDGSLGLATSLQPILTWTKVPAGVGQVRFELMNLNTAKPEVLWSGSGVANGGMAKVTVPLGRVVQGHTYRWKAYDIQRPSVATPSRVLHVDVQRTNVQSLYQVGPLAVAQVSGEPIVMAGSATLATKEGNAAFSLLYRPSNASEAGMPLGWQLNPGSNSTEWVNLKVNADASVTLSSQLGESVTYLPTDASRDSYVPEFGADQSWPNGTETTLVAEHLSDGSTQFTATDANRLVTVFTPTTVSHLEADPAQVYSDTGLVLQQRWSQNRLRAIVDPTSQADVFDFYYSGSDMCPAIHNIAGAIPTPGGMLCAATDWSGRYYGVYYRDTASGPELARFVSGLGDAESAQVTDFAWDASRRLVAVRAPNATADVAAGAIAGLGDQDDRALYQLTYDSQGRVASVIPPAGLVPGSSETPSQSSRVPTTFAYLPYFSASSGGHILRSTKSSITTMLPEWSASASGAKITTTWDVATSNPLEIRDLGAGTITKTTYDASGRPIEEQGPTTSALGGTNVPVTKTAYDQNTHEQAWTGLATMYWDNASFEGIPTTSSVGPVINGSSEIPLNLNFDFPNPPPGLNPGPSGWSARLSGIYLATTAGTYRFVNHASQSEVWLNAKPCSTSCTLELPKDAEVSVRIDVTTAKGTPATGLFVATPGASSVPVLTSALRPDLGYVTSETTYDSLSALSPTDIGAQQKLTISTKVDPANGQILQTTSPLGSTTSNTYNADGSPATSINAAGEVTTTSYYGSQQTTHITCDQGATVAQRGMASSMARPGLTAVSFIYNASGQDVSTTEGTTKSCGTSLGNSLVSSSVTQGTGVSTATMSLLRNNNPMEVYVIAGTVTAAKLQLSIRDLLGRVYQSVDEWGTTTTNDYNPATGLVTSVTQKTDTGESRTEFYSYNVNDQVTHIQVGSSVLEEASYGPTNGLLQSDRLANGVEATYHYGVNNQLVAIYYRFPDGQEAVSTASYSGGGRLLCEGSRAPDGVSTQCYGADLDGKIVSAHEYGTLPVIAKSWSANYPGLQGANADRANLTSALTSRGRALLGSNSESTSIAETFGAGDVLTGLSMSGTPQSLVHDANQRITQQGATSLRYDAAGDLLSVAKGNSSLSLQYGPSGIDEQSFVPSHPADTEVEPVVVRHSGLDLLLNQHNHIVGQALTLASGGEVGLGAAMEALAWDYPSIDGSTAWTSTGTSPSSTQTFTAWGQPNSVAAPLDPTGPVRLVLSEQAWGAGQGGLTIPVDRNLVQLGSRTYDALTGRFLQPDSQLSSANAFAYADGDPVDGSDSTGHWGSFGEVFSCLMFLFIAVAAAALAPVTAGASLSVTGTAISFAFSTVLGFASSVVTQAIDQGITNVDWGKASVNAASALGLSAGMRMLSSGAAFVVARFVRPSAAVAAAEGIPAAAALAAEPAVKKVNFPLVALGRGPWTCLARELLATPGANIPESQPTTPLEALDAASTLEVDQQQEASQNNDSISALRPSSSGTLSTGALLGVTTEANLTREQLLQDIGQVQRVDVRLGSAESKQFFLRGFLNHFDGVGNFQGQSLDTLFP